MVFSNQDRILIQNLYEFKGYGAKRLIQEFTQKGWKLRGLNYLLKRLRETGTTDRLPGSGRPRTSRTAENIDAVSDLVLSQNDAPGTRRTTRQTARELVISRRSVGRIIHENLQLKCLKKRRAQELTAMNCETVWIVHDSCSANTHLMLLTSFALQMRRCSQLRHLSTCRMIGCMHQLHTRSAILLLTACFAPDPHSASP